MNLPHTDVAGRGAVDLSAKLRGRLLAAPFLVSALENALRELSAPTELLRTRKFVAIRRFGFASAPGEQPETTQERRGINAFQLQCGQSVALRILQFSEPGLELRQPHHSRAPQLIGNRHRSVQSIASRFHGQPRASQAPNCAEKAVKKS